MKIQKPQRYAEACTEEAEEDFVFLLYLCVVFLCVPLRFLYFLKDVCIDKPKYKGALIGKDWQERLHQYITGIVQGNRHKMIIMIIINSMPDHVHLFIGMKPHQPLSDLTGIMQLKIKTAVNAKYAKVSQRSPRRNAYGRSFDYMPISSVFWIGKMFELHNSGLMQDVKGDSSKWINDQKFTKHKFTWQEGYGAFSYSFSHIQSVIEYIEYIKNQEEHHKRKTFMEEYRTFLQKFKVEYDERYILREPG